MFREEYVKSILFTNKFEIHLKSLMKYFLLVQY